MVLFGPDGKSLLSVGGNGGARFWDLATRKELRSSKAGRPESPPSSARPIGSFLAAAGEEPGHGSLQGSPVVKRAMAALPTGFYPILIAPDGKTMVSMGGGPATLRLTRIEDKASVTFEDVWEAAAP
ncbi:MAG: WD40 repeat domain-containing protein [Gemmataceae bacterium]